MDLQYGALTNPGKVRDNNEDSFLTLPEHGLFVVADGMGGHNAGEVASALAIETVAKASTQLPSPDFRLPWWKRLLGKKVPPFNPVEWLHNTIVDANRVIHEAAKGSAEKKGMGTTVAMILKREQALLTAHVGDSRVYRLRKNKLSQLTQDHSLAEELVRRGVLTPEEALYAAPSNVLTRALGVRDQVAEDIIYHSVEPGDLFLLCSDGLYNMLEDAEMGRILRNTITLQDRAARLVDAANAAGGQDNITVVLAQFF